MKEREIKVEVKDKGKRNKGVEEIIRTRRSKEGRERKEKRMKEAVKRLEEKRGWLGK